MPDRDLTPLGHLLEDARQKVLRISGREAARRARMSEGRWRQIVTGKQRKGGATLPVRPNDRAVVAMALAVRVDPGQALREAGLPVRPEHLAELIADVQAAAQPAMPSSDLPAEVVEDLDMILGLDLPASTRLRMIRQVVALHEQVQREQNGGEPSRDTR